MEKGSAELADVVLLLRKRIEELEDRMSVAEAEILALKEVHHG